MCSRRDLRGFGGPSLEEDVDFLRCEEEEKAGMREEGIRAGDERGEWREVKMNKAQIFGFSACTRRVTPRCWTRRASRASPPAASPPALRAALSSGQAALAGWLAGHLVMWEASHPRAAHCHPRDHYSAVSHSVRHRASNSMSRVGIAKNKVMLAILVHVAPDANVGPAQRRKSLHGEVSR